MRLLTLTLATVATCNALSLDIVSTSTTKNWNWSVPNGTIFKLNPNFKQEQALKCKKVVVASTAPEDVKCINLHTGIIWYKHEAAKDWYGWFPNYPDSRKWKDIAIANIRYQKGKVPVNMTALYGISHGSWTYQINGLSHKRIDTGNLRRLAVCRSKELWFDNPIFLVLGISPGGWLYKYVEHRNSGSYFWHPHGFGDDLKELACAGDYPGHNNIQHLWVISKSKGHVYHRAGLYGAWTHHHEGLEHTSNGHIASTSCMVSIAVTGKQGEFVYAVDTQGRLWEWGQWYENTENKNSRIKGSGTPKWRLSGALKGTTGKISSVSVAGTRAEVMYVTNTKGAVFVSSYQGLWFTKR